MAREKFRETKHKAPKFRDTYDETLDWQDRMEIKHLRRKLNKKSQKQKIGFEEW
ncbi:MAG: hypothetical protein HOG03_00725 [Desulfobacula sp.]|uniref:hypothetical protein n=1 Tax=Desulfobacula sp. TaxID=2593537 RepID=UPI001D5B0F71|nr:hypothetical protein [Desulfobacula sp.]MBT3484463.1 hypothetical protein [Desulfobacula sp.]MBT3803101.1 hypothetical protein [Desulfobacula sp.]MBT4024671.1 hypothetical protein [Desulfobacula sp.]MBT4197149.1 hypothetical protein [Desulfobacula sp.]